VIGRKTNRIERKGRRLVFNLERAFIDPYGVNLFIA
jgi:hypothetical protein